MPKLEKSVGSLLLGLSVVLLGSGVILPMTQAKSQESIELVTVGDSLTEGIGDTKDMGGYEQRIAHKIEHVDHRDVQTANFGKSGDRSDQILKRLQADPTAQKKIKHADVLVVTAGGNDLQQELFKLIQTQKEPNVMPEIRDTKAQYQHKFEQLFAYLRGQNPHAPIFVYGNYNPLYVYLANRNDLNQAVHLYNGVNKDVALADKNAYYVSVFKPLTYGQYETAPKKVKLVREAKESAQGSTDNKMVSAALNQPDGEKNRYISQADHFHPNNKGYDVMTNELFKVMQKNKKEWLH